MASIFWQGPGGSEGNPTSGPFSVGSNWSTGYVPGSGDDVYMLAGNYELDVDQTESVNSLYNGGGFVYVYNQLTINADSQLIDSGEIEINDALLIAPNGLQLVNGGLVHLKGGEITQGSTSASGMIESDVTIDGYGSFQKGSFYNDSNGIVNADAGTHGSVIALIGIDTGDTVINIGLMEATDAGDGGGYLEIDDVVNNFDGNFTGTVAGYQDATIDIGGYDDQGAVRGGTLEANNESLLRVGPAGFIDGATITVDPGATMDVYGMIEGGSLTSSGTANIVLSNNPDGVAASPELNGLDEGMLTLNASLSVVDGTTVTLRGGVIENLGTIALTGSSHQTELLVQGAEDIGLQGGGRITLASGGTNGIDAYSKGGTLENDGNTIVGNGFVSRGNLILDNAGTIDATGSKPLTVDLDGTSSTNTGTMEASGGGKLEFTGGGLTNKGLFYAASGSTVTFDAAARILNDASGTLTGGTWTVGSGATLSLTGGTVSTLAAAVTLSGANSVFQAGTGTSFSTLDSTLTVIAGGGSLTLAASRAFTDAHSLSLAGTVTVSSGAVLTSGTLKGGSSSTVTGSGGTIASSITDSGAVTALAGGTLMFTGATDSFSGTLGGPGTIAFTKGTDTLGKGASLTAGTVLVNGATVQLGASVSDSGGFTLASGTLAMAASANTLTVTGTATLSGGTVTGPGTLALNGAASTVSAVTLSNATLNHGGTGTLTLGGTVTLGGAKGATDTIGNAGGATVSLNTGTEAVASGVTGLFSNAGTLQKAGGGGLNTLGAALTNTGTVLARTGMLEITGAVGGTGTLAVKGGTLQLDAGPGSGQTLAFQGTGTLALKANGMVAAPISGFAAGDTIDLLTLAGASVKSFTEAGDGKSGTLVIGNGTQTDTLKLAGSYTAANFATAKDAGGNGTAVTFKAGQAKAQVAAAATPEAEAVPHSLLAAMGTGHAGVPFATSDIWLAHGASHLFEPAGLHGSLQAPGLHDFSFAAEPHAFF